MNSDFQPGKTLFTTMPFVHCLSSRYKRVRCDYCFSRHKKYFINFKLFNILIHLQNRSSNKLLQCSGCKYMHYCGKTCQTLDWSVHKSECKHFAPSKFVDLADQPEEDIIKLLIRLIIKVSSQFSTRNYLSFYLWFLIRIEKRAWQ